MLCSRFGRVQVEDVEGAAREILRRIPRVEEFWFFLLPPPGAVGEWPGAHPLPPHTPCWEPGVGGCRLFLAATTKEMAHWPPQSGASAPWFHCLEHVHTEKKIDMQKVYPLEACVRHSAGVGQECAWLCWSKRLASHGTSIASPANHHTIALTVAHAPEGQE